MTQLAPQAIRIIRSGEEPFELPIYPDATYTFGRDRSCTVVFADESVSRDHGMLWFSPEGFWAYRDRGSANGSFLADHLEADGHEEEVQRLVAGRQARVFAGQSVVLANLAARICFLSEPSPVEVALRSRASSKTRQLEADIRKNAMVRMPVFLLGPTGVGKTWAARRIHQLSALKGPFVLIDCGSLPRDMNSLKSELVGHVKGAFSDAREARLGKLFHADGGTVFLDEVESLPVEAQGLLLNLIDGTGDFTPLGAPPNVEQRVPKFRLISASKLPLRQTGLRDDLCNRLGRGGIIVLPTLAERRDDIPALLATMVEQLNVELELEVHFDAAAIRALQRASWPGHIRELEGVVRTMVELEAAELAPPTGEFKRVDGELVALEPRGRRSLIINARDVDRHLRQHQLGFGAPEEAPMVATVMPTSKRPRDLTRQDVAAALAANEGILAHTAQALGIAVNTLKAAMRRYSL